MRDTDLLRAEMELIRFLRKEWAECRKLGYPPMSAFAKDIARGTLAPAAQEEPDPVLDAVAGFCRHLSLRERLVLHERYIAGRNGKMGAESTGLTKRTFNRTLRRIIERLSGYLVKHT